MDKGVVIAKAQLDKEYISDILRRNMEEMETNIILQIDDLIVIRTVYKPAIFLSDNNSFASCGTNIETVKAWRSR